MSMTHTIKATAALVLGGGFLWVALSAVSPTVAPSLSAQRATPEPAAARTDVSAALLAEVRGLRADLAQTNQASLRAQLLVARVQLQEQRIIYFDRRRTDLAARLAEAVEASRKATQRVQELDAAVRVINADTASMPKDQWQALLLQLEPQLAAARSNAQAATESEQRLRVEEGDVQAALSPEQGRWTDFNARLDDLERALPK